MKNKIDIEKYIENEYMQYVYKKLNINNELENFLEKFIFEAVNSYNFIFYEIWCEQNKDDNEISASTLCDLINYIDEYNFDNFGYKYEWKNEQISIKKVMNLFAYAYVNNINPCKWYYKSIEWNISKYN